MTNHEHSKRPQTGETRLPRNLIICCDGTNNRFEKNNTNVVRLVQVLDRDESRQLVYYDPGLGTLPEPGIFTPVGKWISQILGLAFGAGLTREVAEAYTYLMESWQPGDKVFLFGFSRGGYTVRVLAGLLHSLGLLPAENQNLVPYVMRVFKAIRGLPGHGAGEKSDYWELCSKFRQTFARAVGHDSYERRFPVHFAGIWETVSSVGWIWDPISFPYTAHNPGISIIRHAVSIDERRSFFRQNLFGSVDNQDHQEMWFSGVHCDVGGGYQEGISGLWRLSFEWIVDEAEKAGLIVNPQSRWRVLHQTTPSEFPWRDEQQESLKGWWWLAEFFPKLVKNQGIHLRIPTLGLGRHRVIMDFAEIHWSAIRRIREIEYSPPNLNPDFLERVRHLGDVPTSIPYAK